MTLSEAQCVCVSGAAQRAHRVTGATARRPTLEVAALPACPSCWPRVGAGVGTVLKRSCGLQLETEGEGPGLQGSSGWKTQVTPG